MWMYKVSTGELWYNEIKLGVGYSGRGGARNDPRCEALHDWGPIPRGHWKIERPAFDDPQKGPICFRLTPVDHNACERDGFMIHGDNVSNNASHGCVILSHDIRQAISNSTDSDLIVTD